MSQMASEPRPVVGLFVEGSSGTDPLRDQFGKMWRALAEHRGHDIDLRVFGISKGQIIRLGASPLPPRPGATRLANKGQVQLVGGGEPLDVAIARAHDSSPLDRVVVAFDYWRPNQLLPVSGRRGCPMREEVAFVLRGLGASKHLDPKFREAASQ